MTMLCECMYTPYETNELFFYNDNTTDDDDHDRVIIVFMSSLDMNDSIST